MTLAVAMPAGAHPLFSDNGPDLAQYTVNGAFPRADRSTWFLKLAANVDSFSRSDEIWPARVVRRGTETSAWRRAPMPAMDYDGTASLGRGRFSVDQYMNRNPATGLLIARGDTIFYERYQYARTDTQRFASFSMAKTIAALLIGQALQDGAIRSLDDLPESYVPALAGSEYGRTPLRHLLAMTSGVEYRPDERGTVPYLRLLALTVEQKSEGSLALARSFNRRIHPAGARWYYADSETCILGLVLRAAIGRPLADYMAEKIWKPMGAEADASWLIDRSGIEVATGFFNATLRDYARLGRLLADGGRAPGGRQLVPPAWLSEMTRMHFRSAQTGRWYGYGYQTWVFPENDGSFAMQGLHGQAVFIDPARKLVMVHTAVRRSGDSGPEMIALWRAAQETFRP